MTADSASTSSSLDNDQLMGAAYATDGTRVGLWSTAEDTLLLKAYATCGPRWNSIASHISGRNPRQCEKRFRRIEKSRKAIQSQNQPQDEQEDSSVSAITPIDASQTSLLRDAVASTKHQCILSPADCVQSRIRLPSLSSILSPEFFGAINEAYTTKQHHSQHYMLSPVGPTPPQFTISI